MKFQTYKVVVEVVVAVFDHEELPPAETVHQAMCEMLHEDSTEMMDVIGAESTNVGEVTLTETDPELIANYKNHEK